MSTLQQFVLYNLLPSLVAGTVAWMAILAGTNLLRIHHGKLRLGLLSVPLIKSTLVLVGIGWVLPWPREVFGVWNASALPPATVLPVFLLLTGAAVIGRDYLAARSRELAIRDGVSAADVAPRLEESLDRVMGAFASNRAHLVNACDCAPLPGRPSLLVSEGRLNSPLVVTSGKPTIVFPKELLPDLSDKELDGAVAHEVAHLMVRAPFPCSVEHVRGFATVNPMAALMAVQLHREEEKACDDIATTAVGGSDTYAEMLLKSYRFAAGNATPLMGRLQYVPQLLGIKPMLSERIERLLEAPTRPPSLRLQFFSACLLWGGVILVFFWN